MELTEVLVPGPAQGLAGLLDLPAGRADPITDGWALPPLWHLAYLLDRPASAGLGPEGHPEHGIPEPPRPGLRRMYGGGRITTCRPLVLGRPATSRIEVLRSRERTGRTGRMTIVTTRRTLTQDGDVAVLDDTDILYLDTPAAPSPADAEPTDAEPADAAPGEARSRDGREWVVPLDEAFLFRFSALTYNAHRIHYDPEFCRQEGYPGLVVHGPLQGLLMAYLASAERDPTGSAPSTFSYRLVAPLILGEGLVIRCAVTPDGVTTTATDARGRATATGSLAEP